MIYSHNNSFVKLLSIISPPYPQHIALEKYSTQSAEQVVDFNYCNITWPTAPRVSAWSAAMNSVTADSVDSFSKVNRQERGIFEGSDELSDNCFSDNDIEWNSEEDDVISCGENDNLWEEFQQSTFWSPLCSIKQCYTLTSCDNVEDEVPLVKLYLLHIYDFLHNNDVC